ncbi:hypothetical protein [Microbacterium cremeum]|uniref:hypothetical protein n=1 Tax=Microbacterium cremeum TaxID=2782169 RepID=UPI0018871429|nr:hypothetical protein [Microbacterium cremeum]
MPDSRRSAPRRGVAGFARRVTAALAEAWRVLRDGPPPPDDPRLAEADSGLAAYVAAHDPEWFAIDVDDPSRAGHPEARGSRHAASPPRPRVLRHSNAGATATDAGADGPDGARADGPDGPAAEAEPTPSDARGSRHAASPPRPRVLRHSNAGAARAAEGPVAGDEDASASPPPRVSFRAPEATSARASSGHRSPEQMTSPAGPAAASVRVHDGDSAAPPPVGHATPPTAGSPDDGRLSPVPTAPPTPMTEEASVVREEPGLRHPWTPPATGAPRDDATAVLREPGRPDAGLAVEPPGTAGSPRPHATVTAARPRAPRPHLATAGRWPDLPEPRDDRDDRSAGRLAWSTIVARDALVEEQRRI